jgi:hypothetical protein
MIHAHDQNNYGDESFNLSADFDDDSDQYLSALARDEEQEIHSAFINGFKYISGKGFVFILFQFDGHDLLNVFRRRRRKSTISYTIG